MKNYLKELIICGLVLFIILLHTCDNLKPECQENYIHDTVTVEKWDTVHTPPIKIYLKPKNLVPIASYTLNEGEMPKDTNLALKRIYSDSIKDTNLVFYYNIETIGYLSKFEPSYKLFVPQRIEHTINNTITLQPKSRVGIYGGLVIGGNLNNLNLAPFVVLTDKKDRLYGINYSLTNKSVNLSFGFKINRQKLGKVK